MRSMLILLWKAVQFLAIALVTGVILLVIKTHLGPDIAGWIWGA